MNEPIKKVTLTSGAVRYEVVTDGGRLPNGRRGQVRRRFRTRKEAVEYLARLRTQVADGSYIRSSRETVNEHLDAWLESKRLAGKRPSTLRSYTDALKPVRALFGETPLQSFTADDVEVVKAAMINGSARRIGTKGKPLSPRSINLMLITLRQALAQAVKRGKVSRNVADLVDGVAADTSPGAAWTTKEAASFKAVASQDRLHAAWLLTMYGLRRGEVLGLRWERDARWSWIDLNAGILHIGGPEATRTVVGGEVLASRPKTKRGERDLPLDPALTTALRRLHKRQAQEQLAAGEEYMTTGFVVVDDVGRPPRPEWYSDTFRRIERQAGVPPIRLHDARHTSVTIMRSVGVPDHVVAAWHGHDEAVMRRVYTHTFLDDMRAAAAAMAAASSGGL